jgi:hypothetical protein
MVATPIATALVLNLATIYTRAVKTRSNALRVRRIKSNDVSILQMDELNLMRAHPRDFTSHAKKRATVHPTNPPSVRQNC